MPVQRKTFQLEVTQTSATCPTGEVVARRNAAEAAIPVLSCEGPCIRGEIARLAAHRLARQPGFRRACHGELLSVPGSAMADWVKSASEVVVIDGCHLKCHARILEHLVPPERLRAFDATGRHQRYGDLFDYDAVPETEREEVAADVAGWVASRLRDRAQPGGPAAARTEAQPGRCGCGGSNPCSV